MPTRAIQIRIKAPSTRGVQEAFAKLNSAFGERVIYESAVQIDNLNEGYVGFVHILPVLEAKA